jgi:hypothetical protein
MDAPLSFLTPPKTLDVALNMNHICLDKPSLTSLSRYKLFCQLHLTVVSVTTTVGEIKKLLSPRVYLPLPQQKTAYFVLQMLDLCKHKANLMTTMLTTLIHPSADQPASPSKFIPPTVRLRAGAGASHAPALHSFFVDQNRVAFSGSWLAGTR